MNNYDKFHLGCQTITNSAVKRKALLTSPNCANAHQGYMFGSGWSACSIGTSYLQIDFKVKVLLTSLLVAGFSDGDVPKLATKIKIEYQLDGQPMTYLMVKILCFLCCFIDTYYINIYIYILFSN